MQQYGWNVECHQFSIPKIGDMIHSIERVTFSTAIDLNMGYYHIKLDADAQKLCKIVFPWGNKITNAYLWVFNLDNC
jgi:hypothetical protein